MRVLLLVAVAALSTPARAAEPGFEPLEVSPSLPDGPAPPGTPAKTTGARPADMETMTELAVAASGSTGALRYSMNFFGQTSLEVPLSRSPSHPEFVLGGADILMTGKAGASLQVLMEIVVESAGVPPSTVIDLERLELDWAHAGWFTRVGRVHTRMGYWNAAFHHGTWLQPTVTRPRLLRFEDDGGLLPVHSVGVEAGRSLQLGARKLDLYLGVSNGRGQINDDIRTSHDTNLFKALMLGAELSGLGHRDLRMGAAVRYDHIAPEDLSVRPALPDQEIEEVIGQAFLAFRGAQFTGIAEGAVIVHQAGTRSWTTLGGYLVAAYSLGLLAPYAKLEGVRTPAELDPFYSPHGLAEEASGRLVSLSLGLRLDAFTWSSLRLEYEVGFGPTNQKLLLNWSFGI